MLDTFVTLTYFGSWFYFHLSPPPHSASLSLFGCKYVSQACFIFIFFSHSVVNDEDQKNGRKEGAWVEQWRDAGIGRRVGVKKRKKKKISVLPAPRCLAALFKSYWSSINTFNCFLWFPRLWSVAFQGDAVFLTPLLTLVYPARHALGQNVKGRNLCLFFGFFFPCWGIKNGLIILTDSPSETESQRLLVVRRQFGTLCL